MGEKRGNHSRLPHQQEGGTAGGVGLGVGVDPPLFFSHCTSFDLTTGEGEIKMRKNNYRGC